MLRFVFALFSAVLMQSQAFASEPSTKSITTTVDAKGAFLTLEEYPGAPIDLKQFSTAGTITEARILSDVAGRPEFIRYIVLQIDGWTTSGSGKGQCGSGTESSLVWLKVRSSSIAGSQSFLIGSCATNIGGTIPEKGSFNKSYYAADEDREYSVSYDENKPMDGFQITSKEKTF